ncbi:Brix domain-containing protein 1 [Spraguea lophii 42_110]|uniref:Ribosome production factor 2 homolog n=1 Tax=Spraguea lophii (strain 42_110) TaxID=1358809 RepID=S7W8D8_SPRLO|nr:Brix domain-containing protein 1 [Spraguea lophii 42_110]
MAKRKNMLFLNSNKNTNTLINELSSILGNCITMTTKNTVCPFDYTDKFQETLSKKECPLFFTSRKTKNNKNYFVIGRTYEKDILDMIEYEIIEFKTTTDFESIPPELNIRYFLIFEGMEKREENLFLDIFNTSSYAVNINDIKYMLIITKEENIFSLKLYRVEGNRYEEIGPYIKFIETRKHFSDENKFLEACETDGNKRKKNISKNIYNDTIGTIHIPPPNLSDVKVKRSKGFKDL